MRYLALVPLVVLAASACISIPATSGSAPNTLSRPAPASALDCALRVATDSLFTPSSGGVTAGYITAYRRYRASGREQLANVAARLSTMFLVGVATPANDELTLTGAGGKLQVTAISRARDGHQMGTTGTVRAVADAILNACAPAP